jgi:hypothetical protein
MLQTWKSGCHELQCILTVIRLSIRLGVIKMSADTVKIGRCEKSVFVLINNVGWISLVVEAAQSEGADMEPTTRQISVQCLEDTWRYLFATGIYQVF